MNISRNKEHEYIMISIYDALIHVYMNEEFSLEDVMEGVYGLPFDDIPYFSREVVIKSLSHLSEIKQSFQSKMPKWRFERLNTLEQAILIMSYAHMKYSEETDKKVIIDIAIRLSKAYLDKDDYKFVNAVLDNLL